MTEKTIGQWRAELGLTTEAMADSMGVTERTVRLLEASGQTYPDFDLEWGVPISERYGFEKVFWLEPSEAVREWQEALKLLDGFTTMATNTLTNQALIAMLGDAITRGREELDGCRALLENFEHQEEQIKFETVAEDRSVVDGG